MKTINIISYSLFLLLGSASCSSILDENPQGIISDEDLNTVDKVESNDNCRIFFLWAEPLQQTVWDAV